MTRAELHRLVKSVAQAAGAGPPSALLDALGYYASVSLAHDRAAEHVLAAARLCGVNPSALRIERAEARAEE